LSKLSSAVKGIVQECIYKDLYKNKDFAIEEMVPLWCTLKTMLLVVDANSSSVVVGSRVDDLEGDVSIVNNLLGDTAAGEDGDRDAIGKNDIRFTQAVAAGSLGVESTANESVVQLNTDGVSVWVVDGISGDGGGVQRLTSLALQSAGGANGQGNKGEELHGDSETKRYRREKKGMQYPTMVCVRTK